jgi:hypothetical protein
VSTDLAAQAAGDWTRCPEAEGPMSEDDLGTSRPGVVSDPRRPDSTYDAIRRCRAAERAADEGRIAPLDATEVA